MFASLLEADKGGYFRISPGHDDHVSRQLCFPDTAVLITRFLTYAHAPHTVRITPDGATFTPQDAAHGGMRLHVVGAADSPLEEQGIKIERTGPDFAPSAR